MTFEIINTLLSGGLAGGVTGIVGAVIVQQLFKNYFSDKLSEGLSVADVEGHDHLEEGRIVTFQSQGVRGVYRGVSTDGILVERRDDDGTNETVLPLDAADGQLDFHGYESDGDG